MHKTYISHTFSIEPELVRSQNFVEAVSESLVGKFKKYVVRMSVLLQVKLYAETQVQDGVWRVRLSRRFCQLLDKQGETCIQGPAVTQQRIGLEEESSLATSHARQLRELLVLFLRPLLPGSESVGVLQTQVWIIHRQWSFTRHPASLCTQNRQLWSGWF